MPNQKSSYSLESTFSPNNTVSLHTPKNSIVLMFEDPNLVHHSIIKQEKVILLSLMTLKTITFLGTANSVQYTPTRYFVTLQSNIAQMESV